MAGQPSPSSAPRTATRPKPVVEAPFDFAATRSWPDWRDHVAWPVSHAETFRLGRDMIRALLAATRQIADDDLRHMAVLAGGMISSSGLALAETALVAQEERNAGLRFVGEPPELAFLRGELPETERPTPRGSSAFLPQARPRWILPRRLARIKSWSPFWRLPGNLLAPTVTVISHNPLLHGYARDGVERVGFQHAEVLFERARRRPGEPATTGRAAELAREMAQAMARAAALDEPHGARLRRLLLDQIELLLARAERDLWALSHLRGLPLRVWAGTGGYWPSRALGLEVWRRGGHVTRFAHDGTQGITDVLEPFVLGELAVCDTFVAMTPALAEGVDLDRVGGLLPGGRRPRILGHRGVPKLARLPLDRRGKPAPRRRVVYAPTILRGFRQLMPPLLPDVIYLDWQLRVAETLAELPIDLICRPHPEGILAGLPHPLAEVAALSPHPFESLIGRADLFVFDYAQSTTFLEALCTDRPIVFIDMGTTAFTPKVRAALERRCRVIRPRFDEAHRPWVAAEALAEAVCGGGETADPGEFRALFMAEGRW